MKKRIISIILLFGLALAGCSENAKEAETKAQSETASGTADTPITEETEYDIFKELPGQDYDSRDFVFYVPQNLESPVDKGLDCDELIGTVFDDAVYNRNISVEDEYNLNITNHQGNGFGATYGDLKKNVSAGDNIYDVYFTHVIANNASIIADNLCIEWDYIPHVQFDQPWWNESAINNLNMANKRFYAVSSVNIQDVILLVFNKEMASNDPAIGNIYSYVDNGTWTYDKLYELADHAVRDLNGDGKMDEDNDLYGLVYGTAWQLPALMYAADVITVSLDEDGVPVVQIETEQMHNIYDKLYRLLKQNPGTLLSFATDHEVGIHTDRALFVQYNLFFLETLRDGDVDYGIVPLPKYDEAQQRYCTNSWTGMMCVPSTTPEDNYEMIGTVMEAMSFLGYRDVVPKYYDNVLKYKVSRDEESARMIDIIMANITFDIGLNFDTDNEASSVMQAALKTKSPTYASTLQKRIKKIKQEYEKMYEDVLDAGT